MAHAHVPNRRFPLLVQIRDAIETAIGLEAAIGTVVFSSTPAEVPTADDTLVISDGVTAITYTWKAAAAAANEVTIAATATLCAVNFLAVAALNNPATVDAHGNTIPDPERGVLAVYTSALVVGLTNTAKGTLGNVAITDSTANVTVTGMAGGLDGHKLAAV